MSDPQSSYLDEAMARFRAAADSAVQRGRRIAADATAAGKAFDRESDELVERLRQGGAGRDAEPTAADLRSAAAEFRVAHGLAVPEVPEYDGHADPAYGEYGEYGEYDEYGQYGEYGEHGTEPPPSPPRPRPDDDDFSQFRVMRPL